MPTSASRGTAERSPWPSPRGRTQGSRIYGTWPFTRLARWHEGSGQLLASARLSPERPRAVAVRTWMSQSAHLLRCRRRREPDPAEATPDRRQPRANAAGEWSAARRSEEHTSELQSRSDLVCRLLLEKKKI